MAERDSKANKQEPFEVDGYSGFVFLNSSGKVFTTALIFDVIQNIVVDYKRDEYVNARKEKK